MVEVIKRAFPDDDALGHSGNVRQIMGFNQGENLGHGLGFRV